MNENSQKSSEENNGSNLGKITCILCGDSSNQFDNLTTHLYSSHGLKPEQYQKLYKMPDGSSPLIFSERHMKNRGMKKPPQNSQETAETPVVNNNDDLTVEEKKEWASSKEAVREIRKKYEKTNPEKVKKMMDNLIKGHGGKSIKNLSPEEKERNAEFSRLRAYATSSTHFITAAIPGRCNLKCNIRGRCEFLHPDDRIVAKMKKESILPLERFREIRDNAGVSKEKFVRLGEICPIQAQETENLLRNYVTKFDIDIEDPNKMTMVNILVSLTIQYARASKFLTASETVWLGDKISENVGRDGSLISQTLEKVLHPVTNYQDMLIKQIKSISTEMMLTPFSQKTEKIQITTDFSAVLAETRTKLGNESYADDATYEEVMAEEGDEPG